MSNLYKKIEELCKYQGITITTMCKGSGVSRGSLTDLKSDRISTLSTDTMQKIASYFDTSIDFLLGKEEIKKQPTELSGKLSDLENEILKMVIELPEDQKSDALDYLKYLITKQGNV